jgi:hypothetical protein
MKINGPINITRLEGNINNIKKVLYIFSDFHLDPNIQTSCNVDEAIDIDKFLSNTFLELNQVVDFFIEVDYEEILYNRNAIKKRYIDNLINFFSRNFDIDTNNQVKQSSKYKYVRFHYTDIRHSYIIEDYLKSLLNIYFNDTYNNLSTLILQNNNNIFLENNTNQLLQLNNTSHILLLNFYKNYYINKLKNKINNNEVKTKLHIYLDLYYNNIKNTKKITKKYMNELIKITDNYSKMNEYNVNKIIKKIHNPIIELNNKYNYEYNNIQILLLMDLFFLRRFLDKDYIKNAILYCGAHHTIDIMYILINEFNFKITHTTSNINDINNKIKNNKYKDGLYNGIQTLINNNNLIQCSDISSFPKKFS